MLNFDDPLEGWTHMVLTYQQGVPVLFVNGKRVVQGKSSGAIIHPGLETLVSNDQFNSYFEGNFTKPELHRQVLTSEEIKGLYQKGLPELKLLSSASFYINQEGKLRACFLQNGSYELLKTSAESEKIQIQNCTEKVLNSSWMVSFPKDSSTPDQIELPKLMSLIKHDNFDVRHFSGTCMYQKKINLAATDFTMGRKFLLDLGRVEVIAKVIVNGKEAGVYWKEPFVADITEFMQKGENALQVEVTNLWPNRLIGDEHLPVENEYSKDRFILKLPEWYVNNQPKPGDRKSFSVWHNLEKTDPLLESGLLGPVKLILGEEKEI